MTKKKKASVTNDMEIFDLPIVNHKIKDMTFTQKELSAFDVLTIMSVFVRAVQLNTLINVSDLDKLNFEAIDDEKGNALFSAILPAVPALLFEFFKYGLKKDDGKMLDDSDILFIKDNASAAQINDFLALFWTQNKETLKEFLANFTTLPKRLLGSDKAI